MTREPRTVFLSALTLLVYSVSMFISNGAFIFPFPLNEIILLAVSAQFFWWNKNRSIAPGLFALVIGVVAVLSTQFFWTFIYNAEEMLRLQQGLTTDYFMIAFYVLVLVAGIATLFKQKKGVALIFSGLFVLAFILGAYLNHMLLQVLAFGFMVVSAQLSKVFIPYHLLWVLLFVLKLSQWLTIVLNF